MLLSSKTPLLRFSDLHVRSVLHGSSLGGSGAVKRTWADDTCELDCFHPWQSVANGAWLVSMADAVAAYNRGGEATSLWIERAFAAPYCDTNKVVHRLGELSWATILR